MKRDGLITIFVILGALLALFLFTRDFVLDFTSQYKLLGGFIKFFILASLGDFIGARFREGKWIVPAKMFHKAVVWGLIGIVIVMVFSIFISGVNELQQSKILPTMKNVTINKVFVSFMISLLMNAIFAPTMMAFHRMTDTYFNMKANNQDITLIGTTKVINWEQFVRTVIFKLIPLFWIPAHTITFLLPDEYRIIFAAALGIFLGLFLGAFSFKKEAVNE